MEVISIIKRTPTCMDDMTEDDKKKWLFVLQDDDMWEVAYNIAEKLNIAEEDLGKHLDIVDFFEDFDGVCHNDICIVTLTLKWKGIEYTLKELYAFPGDTANGIAFYGDIPVYHIGDTTIYPDAPSIFEDMLEAYDEISQGI